MQAPQPQFPDHLQPLSVARVPVRISTALFVPLLIGGYALSSFGGNWANLGAPIATWAMAFSALSLVVAVAFSVFVYRMWSAIDDGKARTTPGRAIGFLFIPFYNFYWLFQILPGWATDFNAYCARHGIRARASIGPLLASVLVIPLPAIMRSLSTLYASEKLEVAFWVSLISTVLDTIYIVAQTWMVLHVCERVNTLAEHQALPQQPPYR